MNTQPRTIAILSYLWIPGWIIALILYGQSKSAFAGFHLRQALGLHLLCLLLFFIIRFRLPVTLFAIAVNIFGIIQASAEKETLFPLFGEYFQRWFKDL
jgi:hypothetical protein